MMAEQHENHMPQQIKEGAWYDPENDRIYLVEFITEHTAEVKDDFSLTHASIEHEAFMWYMVYLGEL